MSFRADLHCHSSYSDGALLPEELLCMAREVGLQGLSITDHDTVDAYTEDLFAKSRQLQVELLLGVEISSQWQEENVHVLGYGIDLGAKNFTEFLADVQRRRYKRNLKILEKLAARGMVITPEELAEHAKRCSGGRSASVGRPHIAALLEEKKHVSSYSQAFQLLKDGGSCYAQTERYSSADVIDQIHEAKGKAVLAHPSQIVHKRVLDALCTLAFDGIEGHDSLHKKVEEKKWARIASQKGWIVTGGSDFHGEKRGYGFLGSSWVGREVFDRLMR